MFDLSPIPFSLLAGQAVDLPLPEAQESLDFAASLAALLGAQLSAAPERSKGAVATPGKALPQPGKALQPEVPDTDLREIDLPGLPLETPISIPVPEPLPQVAILPPQPANAAGAIDAAGPQPQAAPRPVRAEVRPGPAPARSPDVGARTTSARQQALPTPSPAVAHFPSLSPAVDPPREPSASRRAAPAVVVQVAPDAPEPGPVAARLAEPAQHAVQLPASASHRAVAVQVALAAGASPARAQGSLPRSAPASDNPPPVTGAANPLAPVPTLAGAKPQAPSAATPELPSLMAATPLPALIPSEPAAPAASAPTPPTSDFGAIVDRLIEAREAAGAQPVRIALDHAEFGRVALDFRPADAGLSVAMISADPDFARAASAALVPVVPAEQTQAHSDTSQPRRENGQAADTASQQRTAPERRGEEQRPRHAPAQSERDPARPRRSGIFA